MLAQDTIEHVIESRTDLTPLLRALFVDDQRILEPMREALDETTVPGWLDEAAAIWGVCRRLRHADEPVRLAEAMRGLRFHGVELLRRQTRFSRTGAYQAKSAAAVYEGVYLSEETMQAYLDGLLLACIAWPNRYRLLRFYCDRHLAAGPAGRCLEVGPGHGWLALKQLRSSRENTLLGLDLSPHSVAYTRSVLETAGVEPGRYEIREQDALAGIDPGDGPFDRVVVADVLEHVESPHWLIESAIASCRPGAVVFLSTVVNVEAIDHLYLFRTIDEIEQMIGDCGLAIDERLVMPLAFAGSKGGARNESYEVAYACST